MQYGRFLREKSKCLPEQILQVAIGVMLLMCQVVYSIGALNSK